MAPKKTMPAGEAKPLGTPRNRKGTKKTKTTTADQIVSAALDSNDNDQTATDDSTHGQVLEFPTPAAQPNAVQENPIMITLNRKSVSKSGSKAFYGATELGSISVPLPKRMFANGEFPETVSIDAANVAQLSPEDAAKAQARAEKRAKRAANQTDRATVLAQRQAKLEEKLARTRDAQAKLQAKLGVTPAAVAGAQTANEQSAEPVAQ